MENKKVYLLCSEPFREEFLKHIEKFLEKGQMTIEKVIVPQRADYVFIEYPRFHGEAYGIWFGTKHPNIFIIEWEITGTIIGRWHPKEK